MNLDFFISNIQKDFVNHLKSIGENSDIEIELVEPILPFKDQNRLVFRSNRHVSHLRHSRNSSKMYLNSMGYSVRKVLVRFEQREMKGRIIVLDFKYDLTECLKRYLYHRNKDLFQ